MLTNIIQSTGIKKVGVLPFTGRDMADAQVQAPKHLICWPTGLHRNCFRMKPDPHTRLFERSSEHDAV